MPDAERDEMHLSPGAFQMQDAGIAAFRCICVVEAEFREVAQEGAQFLQCFRPGRDHLPVIRGRRRSGGKEEKSSEKEKDQTTGAGMRHGSARHGGTPSQRVNAPKNSEEAGIAPSASQDRK